jgi:catechol 2,3-dioxygenase-like lactoylglutathione lyase family enzyme
MTQRAKESKRRNLARRRNFDGYRPKIIPTALKVIEGKVVENLKETIELENMKKTHTQATFNDSKQVRLVVDLQKSLDWYSNVLGCEVDGWGHAIRGGMKLILQQAKQLSDVKPNQVAKKRDSYPTDWTGPDLAWDTFVDVNYDEFDYLLEELQDRGANIVLGPIESTHSNGMTFKNIYIKDPDGYIIVFG